MSRHILAAALVIAGGAGCHFHVAGVPSSAPPDQGFDGSVDLFAAADLSSGDLASRDLAGRDLAGLDLSPPDLPVPDMNGGLDLRVADLAPAVDLLKPPDLLERVDLLEPADLLPPVDLLKEPDLLPVGHLSCSVAPMSGALDLTTGEAPNSSDAQTTDWAHWGTKDTTTVERKNVSTHLIGNYSAIGKTATFTRYTDSAITYTWENGTPDAASNGTMTGIYDGVKSTGFTLPIAASTTSRTAVVYVSAFSASMAMVISLTDGSAAAYTNTQSAAFTKNVYVAYTCTYNAASADQSITFAWTDTGNQIGGGNVTIQSALVR